MAAATPETFAAMREERAYNLRQLILRAHRGLNRRIAAGLVARGFHAIKPNHITVYANIDLEGTRISALAERANMTIQGMGQIVAELEELGYLRREEDPTDGRAKLAVFTDEGWSVMVASFEVLRDIEAAAASRLRPGDLDHLRRILTTLFEEQ